MGAQTQVGEAAGQELALLAWAHGHTVKRKEPTERALLLLRYCVSSLTQSEARQRVTDPSCFLTRGSVTGRVSGTADPLLLCAAHTDRETDRQTSPAVPAEGPCSRRGPPSANAPH